MSKPRRKPLTLESLGHGEENGRFWLCESYANSRDNFKVVENYVIGWYFLGDGRRAPVRIAPIYRAAIWTRVGKTRGYVTSYEVGDYLNPHDPALNPPYREDQIANTMALTALYAITSVEARAAELKRLKETSTSAKRRTAEQRKE